MIDQFLFHTKERLLKNVKQKCQSRLNIMFKRPRRHLCFNLAFLK